MSAAAVRILVVGASTASTQATLRGLARCGWESHSVPTLSQASTVLRTIRFQLTLATEKLPDGTGYELAPLVARQAGNLFISVPLSETCLWLPAVEHGVRSLGQRGLNPMMFATEAERILREPELAIARQENAQDLGESRAGEIAPQAQTLVNPAGKLADPEPYIRQAGERFEPREDITAKQAIPPRRQIAPATELVPAGAAPLRREEVIGDLAGLGKRWRGL
jgi:hypothetical protein